jgi:hypothetical protein
LRVAPFLGATVALVACVPSGSAPPYDAGPPSATAAPTFRASINVMTEPFEDDFDRPDATSIVEHEHEHGALPLHADGGHDAGHDAAHSAGRDGSARAEAEAEAEGEAENEGEDDDAGRARGDAHERARSNLGPAWIQARTHAWRVENGRLCGQGARNHGVWLNRTLPVNARIEFDAISTSEDGDLKAEVWGDGRSYATGTSYTNATSYLTILGGWKNTLHVLARLNEHGKDRHELPVDKTSDDPRQRPVVPGQVYHFKIERNDGKTIRWYVDGLEIHKWTDPSPLVGQRHDHFGFNDWEAKVCFDNVKVTPLP